MRRLGRGIGTGLVVIGLIATGEARGQCQGSTGVDSLPGTLHTLVPQDLEVFQPDLSNPGARALALGGAFVSTADDATSAVANPAGLGNIPSVQFQGEVRSRDIVSTDPVGTGAVIQTFNPGTRTAGTLADATSEGTTPFFASLVIPIGDTLVAGVAYQNLLDLDRTSTGIGNQTVSAAGPCFEPFQGLGTVYVLRSNVQTDIQIVRYGASLAWRAAPGISLGVSVFQNEEKRTQLFQVGDATRTYPGGEFQLQTSSEEIGFVGGILLGLGENVRFGASYSTKVEFSGENEVGRNAFLPTTLPSRISAGLTFSPSGRLSLAVDGVLKSASDQKADVSVLDPGLPAEIRNPDNYEIDDVLEIRAGLEWAFVQTRTQRFALRLGGWREDTTRLVYTPERTGQEPVNENTILGDLFRIQLQPEATEEIYHVSGGVGLLSQKKLQIDVGADYDLENEALTASVLVGYSF